MTRCRLWLAVALLLPGAVVTPQEVSGELLQWHDVILTFAGPETSETADPNPFLFYRLDVTFTRGGRSLVVPGYFAADGNAAESSANSGRRGGSREEIRGASSPEPPGASPNGPTPPWPPVARRPRRSRPTGHRPSRLRLA
jgi:Domain of unknown function (DUF5060)